VGSLVTLKWLVFFSNCENVNTRVLYLFVCLGLEESAIGAVIFRLSAVSWRCLLGPGF
jgi:hypothetical protein